MNCHMPHYVRSCTGSEDSVANRNHLLGSVLGCWLLTQSFLVTKLDFALSINVYDLN